MWIWSYFQAQTIRSYTPTHGVKAGCNRTCRQKGISTTQSAEPLKSGRPPLPLATTPQEARDWLLLNWLDHPLNIPAIIDNARSDLQKKYREYRPVEIQPFTLHLNLRHILPVKTRGNILELFQCSRISLGRPTLSHLVPPSRAPSRPLPLFAGSESIPPNPQGGYWIEL